MPGFRIRAGVAFLFGVRVDILGLPLVLAAQSFRGPGLRFDRSDSQRA